MNRTQGRLSDEVRGGLARKRWRQKRLAQAVGISEKHLSQMLNGTHGTEGSLGLWDRLLEAVER